MSVASHGYIRAMRSVQVMPLDLMVAFYTDGAFAPTKSEAIKTVVAMRLAIQNQRGKGNRAMRRLRAKARVHELPLAQVRE